MADQVEDAHDGDLQLLGQGQRVAGMIAMAVGDQDMRGAVDGLGAPVVGKDGVSAEPGVDQDHGLFDLQTKAGMAKPGQFHGVSFALSRQVSGRVRS